MLPRLQGTIKLKAVSRLFGRTSRLQGRPALEDRPVCRHISATLLTLHKQILNKTPQINRHCLMWKHIISEICSVRERDATVAAFPYVQRYLHWSSVSCVPGTLPSLYIYSHNSLSPLTDKETEAQVIATCPKLSSCKWQSQVPNSESWALEFIFLTTSPHCLLSLTGNSFIKQIFDEHWLSEAIILS